MAVPFWPIQLQEVQMMEISLPPDQQSFLEELVQSGQYSSTDEAISECVRRLMNQEQLKQRIDAGIQQADRGDVIDHDTVFANLRSRAAELQESKSGQ